MAAQTMTPAEFHERFRKRRYVQAKYRSLDTAAPAKLAALPSLTQGFTLSMILAASYPDLALITN